MTKWFRKARNWPRWLLHLISCFAANEFQPVGQVDGRYARGWDRVRVRPPAERVQRLQPNREKAEPANHGHLRYVRAHRVGNKQALGVCKYCPRHFIVVCIPCKWFWFGSLWLGTCKATPAVFAPLSQLHAALTACTKRNRHFRRSTKQSMRGACHANSSPSWSHFFETLN